MHIPWEDFYRFIELRPVYISLGQDKIQGFSRNEAQFVYNEHRLAENHWIVADLVEM